MNCNKESFSLKRGFNRRPHRWTIGQSTVRRLPPSVHTLNYFSSQKMLLLWIKGWTSNTTQRSIYGASVLLHRSTLRILKNQVLKPSFNQSTVHLFVALINQRTVIYDFSSTLRHSSWSSALAITTHWRSPPTVHRWDNGPSMTFVGLNLHFFQIVLCVFILDMFPAKRDRKPV